MKAQHKIPKKVLETEEGNVRFSPFENDLHLEFPLRIELRGRTVGAFVLSNGAAKVESRRYRFVFGFECQGVHSTLKHNQQAAVFDAIESGLKDLPAGETLTIHASSFADASQRQSQLEHLFHQAQIPQLKFLIQGEKHRVEELSKNGVRKPKSLFLYVTYTIDFSTLGTSDRLEQAVAWVRDCFHAFSGVTEELQSERFEHMFLNAFTDGFQMWEQVLSTKMGLAVSPLNEQQLWENCWGRFNPEAAPPLPQLVRIDESGLSEKVDSNEHPISWLIGEQCPQADRSWVHVKDKFLGVLAVSSKPMGWIGKNEQLRYLWDILAREQVTDTEIFSQFSRANEADIKTAMQRMTKQSIVASDHASSRQSIDVAADLKVRKTIAAQEQLYEGHVPLRVATVFLVHRDSPAQLDEACRYLQSCVRLPARLDREKEYAWKLWLQTLPIHWDALLSQPFQRQLTFLSSEAPGFMPLVRPKRGDASGFELLSEEGGVPIYVDLFRQHRNIGIFGTTRSGKSVLVSGILTQALAEGMPIVALDFPKPDGSSTFSDYTRFMGKAGAYFDIGSESNNLFEIPDLRGLPLHQQQERLEDYRSFLEGALMTMVTGGSSESINFRNTVRSLIVILMDQFFKDKEILARYDQAIAAGFGSAEWQSMPTLNDFIPFCELPRLGLTDISDETIKAMGQMKLQLKFWVTSRVGKAISAPSSFPTDAQLIVFALRNLNDDADAAILALSAYSAALRRALASPRSIFFIDESPILFQYVEIAALVARVCANGAKAGIRVIISGQDPDTIANSPSASKILQNLSTRLIGRIQPTAVASFVKYLDYAAEIISRNAGESFFPKRTGIYSQWLLDDSGTYTYCRFYPSYRQIAAVANNTDEQAARTAYLRHYESPYKAFDAFAKALVASMRDDRPIRLPVPMSTQTSSSAPALPVPASSVPASPVPASPELVVSVR